MTYDSFVIRINYFGASENYSKKSEDDEFSEFQLES